MDIPSQGLHAGGLVDVIVDGASRRFTLRPPAGDKTAWAVFDVTLDATGGRASGSLKQFGQVFLVVMERLAAGDADRVGAQVKTDVLPGDRWSGSISLPADQTLELSVRLVRAAGGGEASGFMDIPQQGVADGGLRDVEIGEGQLAFTLATPGAPEATWAKFKVIPSPDGASAAGQMLQSGGVFPVSMKRLGRDEAAPALPRPQLPKPPFPYTSREVTVANGDTRLAGTLTVPAGKGPYPAALLITGSGPEDRDETLFGHQPFLVIADHLSRNGIAVLRVDDRGVGGSTGNATLATSEDFAGDALAGIEFLRQQPEISAAKVGLIGHSEGGLIAAKVAARDDRVAFVVMLAGPGVPGRDVVLDQSVSLHEGSGSQAEAAKCRELTAVALDLLIADAPLAKLKEAIGALVRAQMAAEGVPVEGDKLEALVAQALAQMTSPWYRYFIRYDPATDLRRVKAPVLALDGSKDVQVSSAINLPAIERALRAGGNTDVTVVELPGLNHLFQTATTGGMEEYGLIEETFAPAALERMTGWIRARVESGR